MKNDANTTGTSADATDESIAATPNPQTALASQFLQVDALPWKESRFPGIRSKLLLADESTGLQTSLLSMEPGARLPDHEHVGIEQTWVIEGQLECREGLCQAGNFVWRPAGSRHEAWAGPNGALLLGMFQVPNRFFETNGRELDFAGNDWMSASARPGQGQANDKH